MGPKNVYLVPKNISYWLGGVGGLEILKNHKIDFGRSGVETSKFAYIGSLGVHAASRVRDCAQWGY